MADSNEVKKPIRQAQGKRQLKKQPTVRERAEKAGGAKKQRRLKQAGSSIARPLKAVARSGRKEYYLPLPDNKAGRFLNKRRKIVPGYFRGAWGEVKQVKWPGRTETAKLTFAVFMFAIFFMIIITAADFVLDKLFKQLILK